MKNSEGHFWTWNFETPKKKQKEKKMILLEPKIEKSPTYGDFENFYPHPQLDIKFSNP